jgi:hypothetical protein
MAVPGSSGREHFSIFKSAAEEAAEVKSHDARDNEHDARQTATAVAPAEERREGEPEAAINELVFALYADDVRLGIVRRSDVEDNDGALSLLGGGNYHRRAVAILNSLSRVSDAQIVQACSAEGSETPRGAAARVEFRRRSLSDPR